LEQKERENTETLEDLFCNESGTCMQLVALKRMYQDAVLKRFVICQVLICIIYKRNINYLKISICPINAHNSYKIVKQLNSFKIIIVAPTCFGLHKPSSGSSHPVLCQSYKVDIGYIYRYLKLSVLWLHVDRAMEGTIRTHNRTEQNMKPQTSNNDIFNSYQHCNFSESQAESSLMMVYVNRNMLEQLL
jgi:hypothetical protein